MMRLQRVGRKNDPSYRIVVCDKRTGPKSNKNVAILGSYNPKMKHIQLDTEAAKDWLSKGVQPSDTVHNILVGQKVIDAKKVNPLPRKSPIVDEEATKKEEDSKEAEAAAETPKNSEAEKAEAEDPKEEAADATSETPEAEETPADLPAQAGEVEEETPAEEPAKEEKVEAPDEDTTKEAEAENKEA